MEDWFTIEEIDTDTYAISEYKHWEETHCYLVCGNTKAVLIDTGLGIANICKVVEKLTKLPVLVVTTHVHWDHIGGHQCFKNIAVHEKEKSWIEGHFPLTLDMVKANLLAKPCEFPEGFCLEDYQIFQGKPTELLTDGERIDLGGRSLEVLHTPGHSPGHCCFYENERGYLFSGDLIYQGCLDAFYPTTDPYKFWKSVQKMERLPIKKILPGHHKLDIETGLLHEIAEGFSEIQDEGKLQQGEGIFSFEKFQIHI